MSKSSFNQISEPDFMITSDVSNSRDEQTNSWFKPGCLNKSASSSSTVVLNFVLDEPSETTIHIPDPELSTSDQPSSSNLAIQACTPARKKREQAAEERSLRTEVVTA